MGKKMGCGVYTACLEFESPWSRWGDRACMPCSPQSAYAACDINTVAQLFLLHKQESQRDVLKKIGRVDLSHILMCSKTKAVLCISKYSPW